MDQGHRKVYDEHLLVKDLMERRNRKEKEKKKKKLHWERLCVLAATLFFRYVHDM